MSVEIPLYSFLIIYLVYIGIFLIFSLFNIYHLVKHGFSSVFVYVVIILYIVIAAVVVFITYYYLQDVEWSQVLSLLSEKYKSLGF